MPGSLLYLPGSLRLCNFLAAACSAPVLQLIDPHCSCIGCSCIVQLGEVVVRLSLQRLLDILVE